MLQEVLERLAQVEKAIQELKEQIARCAEAQSIPRTSLYGIWKGKFPDDLDVDKELADIRKGWRSRLQEHV
ncbi:hypothetical protein HRbin07_00072 [bacterium HR07]|nr:hypothetical protein HRbin07_00072 [bacterium HR07]